MEFCIFRHEYKVETSFRSHSAKLRDTVINRCCLFHEILFGVLIVYKCDQSTFFRKARQEQLQAALLAQRGAASRGRQHRESPRQSEGHQLHSRASLAEEGKFCFYSKGIKSLPPQCYPSYILHSLSLATSSHFRKKVPVLKNDTIFSVAPHNSGGAKARCAIMKWVCR